MKLSSALEILRQIKDREGIKGTVGEEAIDEVFQFLEGIGTGQIGAGIYPKTWKKRFEAMGMTPKE